MRFSLAKCFRRVSPLPITGSEVLSILQIPLEFNLIFTVHSSMEYRVSEISSLSHSGPICTWHSDPGTVPLPERRFLALESLQEAFQTFCDQAGANAQLFNCQRYINFHTYIGGLVVQVVQNT